MIAAELERDQAAADAGPFAGLSDAELDALVSDLQALQASRRAIRQQTQLHEHVHEDDD